MRISVQYDKPGEKLELAMHPRAKLNLNASFRHIQFIHKPVRRTNSCGSHGCFFEAFAKQVYHIFLLFSVNSDESIKVIATEKPDSKDNGGYFSFLPKCVMISTAP